MSRSQVFPTIKALARVRRVTASELQLLAACDLNQRLGEVVGPMELGRPSEILSDHRRRRARCERKWATGMPGANSSDVRDTVIWSDKQEADLPLPAEGRIRADLAPIRILASAGWENRICRASVADGKFKNDHPSRVRRLSP